MKRLLIFTAVSCLMVGATSAAAKTVSNSSGTQTEMGLNWEIVLNEGAVHLWGNAYAADPSDGDPFINYWLELEELRPGACTSEAGEVYDGWLRGYDSLWGPASGFEVDRRFAAGHAEGTLSGYAFRFLDCGWYQEEFPPVALSDIPGSLDVTAVGDIMRTTDSGSFHIPGEVNDHWRSRAKMREAEGMWMDGKSQFSGMGMIGEVSWKQHHND